MTTWWPHSHHILITFEGLTCIQGMVWTVLMEGSSSTPSPHSSMLSVRDNTSWWRHDDEMMMMIRWRHDDEDEMTSWWWRWGEMMTWWWWWDGWDEIMPWPPLPSDTEMWPWLAMLRRFGRIILIHIPSTSHLLISDVLHHLHDIRSHIVRLSNRKYLWNCGEDEQVTSSSPQPPLLIFKIWDQIWRANQWSQRISAR